jgi:hypothetical protein
MVESGRDARATRWRFKPRKSLSGVAADIRDYLRGAAVDYSIDIGADPLAYPLALDRLLDADPDLFAPLDPQGVPLQITDQGAHYIPSRIAGFGLAQWNRARSSDAADAEAAMVAFLRTAEWFARQPRAHYLHHLNLEGMASPWPSCLAQGQGVSVLVRAWRASGERRFLTQARAALRLLQSPVDAGGVASRLPGGDAFVEEYPGGRHRHVLNGALFAVTGLDDLVRLSTEPEPSAEALRDDLLASLERALPLWSVAGWSIYSLDRSPLGLPNACTVHYHCVHLALLEHLAGLAPGLGPVARQWRAALGRPGRRLAALAMKTAYRVSSGW